jgi:hypothetical protein
MGLFRRREESLNERLLREGGLDPTQVLGDAPAAPELSPEPPPPPSALALLGRPHGLSAHSLRVGANDWDTCVTATVPALAGDRIEFTTIPSGDVIVSEESGDADLSALADAVERHVDPPYRAVAARQGRDLWAVGAKRIEVAQVPFPAGEKLELSRNGVDEELRVDGEGTDLAAPVQLERVGEAVGDSFYVEAERIDGDLWEVRATAL